VPRLAQHGEEDFSFFGFSVEIYGAFVFALNRILLKPGRCGTLELNPAIQAKTKT
jgi:hypothetical protein